jgi:pimeloyl-ACP methyl ester carboxylesterase
MLGGWESGDVDANGIRLHYTRTGGEKPAVVLAHGVTDSGLCWTPLAAALAADYDVVMADARGHGRSQETESGYDPATQADDLAGLIATLGLRKPAILGHSMGAATALVLAGNHPDMPGAILLEDPPAWWTPWYDTPEARERVTGMREQAMARKAMTRAELIAAQRSRQPGWSAAELEPWADAKQSISVNVLRVLEADNPRAVDWAAVLPRITCPVLLIVSDPALGGIVTTESAALLKGLVPQTDVVQIPDAGHNIRRDQFDRYLEDVRGFLAAHVPAAS